MDDLDYLRTKLLLLGACVIHVHSTRNSTEWAVVKTGTSHFRFKPSELRRFYPTEQEALEDGIKLSLEGHPLTDLGEYRG